MNIISNSCVGAFLTRDYFKEEFSNPFIWSYIDIDSFYNLIKNYKTINWFNYELVKDKNWHFSIIIDKQVKVEYPHYRFDKTAKTLKFYDDDNQNRNVYSNKIWEYIVEKYETRVKRMLIKNEDPLFVIATKYDLNEMHSYNNKAIKNIDELDSPFNIVMFSKHYKFNNKKSYTFQYSKNNIELAKEIYNMNVI